jgi:saccharopine dehydrogenase (NAD+, L-lysine forming)
MALLGSGFDPGVTGVFLRLRPEAPLRRDPRSTSSTATAATTAIPFATNFNPEINIREVTPGSYWENGEWVETEPMEIKRVYDFDPERRQKGHVPAAPRGAGVAGQNIKGVKRIRFFMTFGQSYLTHLKCLENVGMTSIEPIDFEGHKIIPLQFLKAVLPDPASLGPRTVGKTNIGCIFKGVKDGKPSHLLRLQHLRPPGCYREVGSQAISYTTGVPAMIGAMMMLNGGWAEKISAGKCTPMHRPTPPRRWSG